MKEMYLEAEMDVLEFSVEDVITTSYPIFTNNTTSCQPGENEGPAGDAFL